MAASALVYRSIDVQPTGQVVLATPCRLVGAIAINSAVAARFLKIYDKATAATQADTPKLTIPLAASTGLPVMIPEPIRFVNGISIRATTGVADNDVAAPTANDVIAHILYD